MIRHQACPHCKDWFTARALGPTSVVDDQKEPCCLCGSESYDLTELILPGGSQELAHCPTNHVFV